MPRINHVGVVRRVAQLQQQRVRGDQQIMAESLVGQDHHFRIGHRSSNPVRQRRGKHTTLMVEALKGVAISLFVESPLWRVSVPVVPLNRIVVGEVAQKGERFTLPVAQRGFVTPERQAKFADRFLRCAEWIELLTNRMLPVRPTKKSIWQGVRPRTEWSSLAWLRPVGPRRDTTRPYDIP